MHKSMMKGGRQHPVTGLPEPVEGVTHKHIPGFPGYAAGDDGTIWSCKPFSGDRPCHWKQLRGMLNDFHYHIVTLMKLDENGKRAKTIKRVSRLILETFVGPCPPGMEACHGPDPDRSNNRLDNLKWDTHANNMKDCLDRGTHSCRQVSKTTPEQKERIIWLLGTGAPIEEIAAIVGCDVPAVRYLWTTAHKYQHRFVPGQPYEDSEGVKRRTAILKAWDDLLAPAESAVNT